MSGLALPYVMPPIGNPDLELKKYLNFLVAMAERRARRSSSRALPIDVTIDPASVCQLECPYCAVGAGTIQRTKMVMKPDVHRRMLAELADPLFVIFYFNAGEPLLNKRFAEVVSDTRGKEIFSVVSTNLSLELSDERIDELLDCGLGIISVSLDGASPASYVKYRVKGEFDLVVENVRRLVRRKRQRGLSFPLIEWRFLVFRHNQDELLRARAMAVELGVDLLEFYPGGAPEDAKGDEVQRATIPMPDPVVSGPALVRLNNEKTGTLSLFANRHPNRQGPPLDPAMRHLKCDWLYLGSALFPTGSIGPCCVSDNEPDDFGTIADGTTLFSQVWNNPKYLEARNFMAKRGPTNLVCSRCPIPQAQDYQYRSTIEAVLRNAPDWALAVLQQLPDHYFFPVDLALSPTEVLPIVEKTLPLSYSHGPVLEHLTDAAAARPDLKDQVDIIRGALQSHLQGARVSAAVPDVSLDDRFAIDLQKKLTESCSPHQTAPARQAAHAQAITIAENWVEAKGLTWSSPEELQARLAIAADVIAAFKGGKVAHRGWREPAVAQVLARHGAAVCSVMDDPVRALLGTLQYGDKPVQYLGAGDPYPQGWLQDLDLIVVEMYPGQAVKTPEMLAPLLKPQGRLLVIGPHEAPRGNDLLVERTIRTSGGSMGSADAVGAVLYAPKRHAARKALDPEAMAAAQVICPDLVESFCAAYEIARHIDGWLHVQEAARLYALGYYAEEDVLEIGTYYGKSTVLIALGLRDGQKSGRVITLDVHWRGIDSQGQPLILAPDSQIAVGNSLKLYGLTDRVIQMIGWSEASVALLDFHTIGAIFIDGGHDFESCHRDFLAVRKKMRKDRLVQLLFHDYGPGFEGVQRTVDQYVKPDARFAFKQLVCSLFVSEMMPESELQTRRSHGLTVLGQRAGAL